MKMIIIKRVWAIWPWTGSHNYSLEMKGMWDWLCQRCQLQTQSYPLGNDKRLPEERSLLLSYSLLGFLQLAFSFARPGWDRSPCKVYWSRPTTVWFFSQDSCANTSSCPCQQKCFEVQISQAGICPFYQIAQLSYCLNQALESHRYSSKAALKVKKAYSGTWHTDATVNKSRFLNE